MAPTVLEKLVAKRHVIENNLLRINEKIRDHRTNPLSCRIIERYEESIDNDIVELRILHCDIIVATPDVDDHKKKFTSLCDAADFMSNVLHGIKISIQQPTTATVSQSSSASATKLPKLDLNTFDGNLLEWISFRDMFSSAVHNNSNVPKIQKLVYLKSLLKGEAARLVQSLILSESNYDTAWKLLHDRYQNDREILYSVLRKLFRIPNSNQSASVMRQIVDNTKECMRSMEILNLKPEKVTEAMILYILLEKLDPHSRQLWEQTLTGTSVPPLSRLFEFLEQRSRALAASGSSTMKSKPQREEREIPRRVQAFHGHSSSSCKSCNGTFHPLFKCAKFQAMTIRNRYDFLKKTNSCFNCLAEGHSTKSCGNSHRCKHCKEKHHSLLHTEPKTDKTNVNETQSVVQNHHSSKSPSKGLLVTAVTLVKGNDGQHHVARAFLDSGSTASFISEPFVNQLGLTRKQSRVEVVGLGATNVGTTQGAVTISISPYFDKAKQFSIEALVIPKVTQNIPDKMQHPSSFSHLKNIKLADPSWYHPAPVDILLGSDVFWTIVGSNRLQGTDGSPTAVDSKLGWLVAGTASTCNRKVEVHYTSEYTLNDQLKQFWELESLQNVPQLTPTEQKTEEHYNKTVSRDTDGSFVVSLPFKSNPVELGESKEMALRRLKSLERRLSANPNYYTEYKKFMQEYEDMGHMTKITYRKSESIQPVFIPHHFVLKQESTTTKFRVVFDASAKTSNGTSLNDSLLIGPTLQDPLVDIVHRFRRYPIAFTADIAKMYRQIKVAPADRPYQNILWRPTPDEPVSEYVLNTVTYGTACAPYLAVKCLRTLAEQSKNTYSVGSNVALKDFYVDDVMHSCPDVSTAITTQLELRNLCSSGGFPLRKWISNSKELLESIPKELREQSHLFDISIDPAIKTLGIRWNTKADEFQFRYEDCKTDQNTKRSILSSIAKLYDPMGWLAPVVVRAKIFMQDLWKLELSWDQPLPQPKINEWNQIKADFKNINAITIPRCLLTAKPNEIILAGFSDASEKAYAACVYLCCISDCSFKSSLLASKTRVAPVKTVSLPRLELCGAHLLVELMESVYKSLDLEIVKFRAWSDSTIVLNWIQSPPSKWKTFVANRISLIQSCSIPITWHHVSSEENPADCASRGLDSLELANFHLWWIGPEFLKNKTFNHPIPQLESNEKMLTEAKSTTQTCFNQCVEKEYEMLYTHSNMTTVLRVTAWCIRFGHNTKMKSLPRTGPLEPVEIQSALHAIIKCTQSDLPRKSPILGLHPFIDQNGLIRVGGRLRHSLLPDDQKFPILLPRHSKLTEMIISQHHLKYLHAGPCLTQSLIQKKFWIIRCKDAVRFQIRKCVVCAKSTAKPLNQFMGDLPSSRVTPSPAFSRCGVDYAGPFNLKSGLRKQSKIIKSYLALFVCFSTRAFHLELVSALTTDAFLAALKRFVSRRGLPSHIYSDCGTNFVGADKELKRLFSSPAHNARVADSLSQDSIHWRFNPAAAPHFGGLWEAGVKSVKYHLNRILSNHNLTYEEMTTTFAQVEACLNSRPLTALSSDPNDLNPLTSGHFLIGRPLLAIPEEDVTSVSQNRLSRWQLLQKINQHFWSRWSSEFLSRLQQRPKWLQHRENIKLNDLVIIKDHQPPQMWKMARVIEVHPGSDKMVRVVTLRTKDGNIKRPIHKICLLPVVDNPVINPNDDIV